MDTLARGSNSVRMSSLAPVVYSKRRSKFLSSRVHPSSKRGLVFRKANKKAKKLSPFIKMAESLPSESLPLKAIAFRMAKNPLSALGVKWYAASVG